MKKKNQKLGFSVEEKRELGILFHSILKTSFNLGNGPVQCY
jgi:hypothetical protein